MTLPALRSGFVHPRIASVVDIEADLRLVSALSCLTGAVRRTVRQQVESRQASVLAAAPRFEDQVQGAFMALATCVSCLDQTGDERRQLDQRRRLHGAATDVLAYLVAALTDGGRSAVDSALDEVEREIGRFAVHAERGSANPTTGASPAADVAAAMRFVYAAAANPRSDDTLEYLVRAAASLSLVVDAS